MWRHISLQHLVETEQNNIGVPPQFLVGNVSCSYIFIHVWFHDFFLKSLGSKKKETGNHLQIRILNNFRKDLVPMCLILRKLGMSENSFQCHRSEKVKEIRGLRGFIHGFTLAFGIGDCAEKIVVKIKTLSSHRSWSQPRYLDFAIYWY